jgi:outer membrane protein OmpU
MKKLLFATTAAGALAIGGAASAQGISLFGDARLGLGYNIDNDGEANGDEDLRAVSRVRFGVRMTGETTNGIAFGAEIRADNAPGGQGGSFGQRAGSVFVSGSYGSLTFGDTNGADEQNVGDIPGNLSLTGLGDQHETLFISNGGDFGSDDGRSFAENPFARPTIRYDYEIAGFNVSLSSNRDLTDVGVGASYAGEYAAGSWSIGAGYYDFDGFTVFGEPGTEVVSVDLDGDGIPEDVVVETVGIDTLVQGGEQWSVGGNASWNNFSGGVVFTDASSSEADFQTLGFGLEGGFGAITVGGYWVQIISAGGTLEDRDSDDSYGVTAAYDLGGGATLAGGVAQVFDTGDDDEATVADFGIRMAF